MTGKLSVLCSILFTLLFLFTPPHASAAELITNGSFETGNFTGWTATNAPNPWFAWQVVGAGFNNGFSAPASPQHGSFVAYEAVASDPGSYTLMQQITVPVGTASLTWRHRFQLDNNTYCNGATCGTATFAVEVLNTSNIVLETLYILTVAPDTTRDTTWAQGQRSLSAYSGQTIRIRFRTTVTASYAGPGQLELDQVSVQSPSVLVPTAATASIAGRVLTPDGTGLRNATVNLTDQTGAGRIVRTNSFGNFVIDSVESGRTYFVNVSAKGWTFQPMVLDVVDDVAELEIIADGSGGKEFEQPLEPAAPIVKVDRDPYLFFR